NIPLINFIVFVKRIVFLFCGGNGVVGFGGLKNFLVFLFFVKTGVFVAGVFFGVFFRGFCAAFLLLPIFFLMFKMVNGGGGGGGCVGVFIGA
ncbi:hypothetical protein, partial [Mesorhizobium japonicum]|uniref:hypothetical protein n=1 Tax=Mesorhizobium japonicum TaxID=2066070 RepID=UPI003B597D7E